jgi:ATP-binding cassette subfamily B protein
MTPSPDADAHTGTGTEAAPDAPTAVEQLPPSLRSLWRTVQLGYRAEPRGLSVSFGLVMFTALPDALIALWLAILTHAVLHHDERAVLYASLGLAGSATLTWFLKVVFDRVQRRFRDRVAIALETHVAELQATVATVEHHERPEYLDRLAVLRDQVFALDHLFMSLFSTVGWIVRLAVTIVLLMSINPLLVLLVVFAIPTVFSASWRPGIERTTEERVAPHNRLARHLFVLGTSAPPGKEIRVAGAREQLADRRNAAWQQWYGPVSAARWTSAIWHTCAWALFAGAYVGAIVFVASGLHDGAGQVILVLVAGSRLSQYVGATVGEIGFLRGIWLDSSRRLTWLEDYAGAIDARADASAPARLEHGIHLDHVSFAYPGTDRLVLDDVTLDLPAGAVVAIVGENGAGKTTLVKLLCRMYAPTSGRIEADGVDIRRIPSPEWRGRLAGAFQDFFRFEFSVQRAVGLGEVERLDERPAVEAAVDRAGADDVVERLAHGFDTQLGPTWDAGVEVSFGQWQKLALARGFMRDDPLLLMLDEPTAALDAETEHELFERFAGAAHSHNPNGRVTVLVSHRFSTVRMADLIVVLDGARVVEVGTHEELMANRAQYAELYAIQAAAYQ